MFNGKGVRFGAGLVRTYLSFPADFVVAPGVTTAMYNAEEYTRGADAIVKPSLVA